MNAQAKTSAAPIAKVPEAKKEAPKVQKDNRKITMGGKDYNPRVPKNASAWNIVQAHFGKTMHDLIEALKQNSFEVGDEKVTMHHVDFIGYMWRKGHILIDGKAYTK